MFFKTCINFIAHIFQQIAFKLFPSSCMLCTRYTEQLSICQDCLHSLPILPQHCPKCGQFLYSIASHCGTCLKHPPSYDKLFALFPYQKPIPNLIIQLKFNTKLPYANCLAELFLQRIPNDWYVNQALPDLIIPIPLHDKRLTKRGFNQSVEIARPIAKTLNIPLDLTPKRIKNTSAQSGLALKERQKNMKKAFELQRNYYGLHVAVLDDVVTTGYTIGEFCKLLKQHGAKTIDIWCIARRG